MKIGIVTFYGVANYGAMLQAYALWKFLENRGHSVEFVDVDVCRVRRSSFFKCLISRSLAGLKFKLSNYIQHHITDFSTAYPQTRRFTGFQDLKDNCPKYDVLIVGSDQMWNPKWCAPDAIPIVFLGFAPRCCSRISFAVSFGVMEWEHKESAEEVGRLLREFQAISVREKSGREIVGELSGMTSKCIVDPTILWDSSFYQTLLDGCQDADATAPYVFNYVLNAWTDGVQERMCLGAVIRSIGVRRVLDDSYGPKGLLAPLCWALGVWDRVPLSMWLARIANAEFVVTNSFHGTVFSILFRRPFVTVLIRGRMAGMNDRVRSLLFSLGLENRMVYDADSAIRAVNAPINWMTVYDRMQSLRLEAEGFLKDNNL